MHSARKLADALADSPLGPLLQRMALIQRIAATISPTLTHIAPDFDVFDPRAVNLKESVLVLNARTAAQAAKLRQAIPGLLRLLHQHGFQLIEIRVRVQPAHMSYPEGTNPRATQVRAETAEDRPGPRPGTRVDAGVMAFADRLARDLPDSPLRAAIDRLQRALRRGRA